MSVYRSLSSRYLLFLALIFFLSCKDDGEGNTSTGPDPQPTGNAQVTVMLGNFGIEGVAVSLQGPATKSATTDSSGIATIEDLPVGTYSVTISGVPAGVTFSTLTASVSVVSGTTGSASFQGTSALTLSIEPDSVELVPNEPRTLNATVRDVLNNTLSATVTWESNAPNIASIDSDGTITGQALGQTVVTATTAGASGQADVWVVATALADSVQVIDSTTYALLSDSTELARGTLRFQTNSGTPGFEVGSIVVGTQGGGYLKRVTSVSVSGSTVTLETEQASLSEAVKSGEFQSSATLTPLGPQSVSGDAQFVWGQPRVLAMAEGVSTTASGIQLDLAFDEEVCDQSGNACANLTMSETGSIDFTPEFNVGGKFGWTGLKEFNAEAIGTLEMSLGLSATISGAVDWEKEQTLISFGYPFATAIGLLPVVGQVQITFVGGVSANLDAEASFETGASAAASLTLGAYYVRDRNPAWATAAEPSLDYTDPTADWDASATAQLKAWVRPEIQVEFYAVAGPYIGAEPYLVFDGQVNLEGWEASLAGGIDADLGFKVEILDYELADFNYFMEGPRVTIWEDGANWDPPSISTTSLGNGVEGTTYSQAVTATGGSTPYTWTISAGSLPDGLDISSSAGVIGGTPTSAGSSSFTVMVTDANSLSDTQSLSITIGTAPTAPTITTTTLPGGTVDESYSQAVAATGGSTPYTWTISSGALPGGLGINASTGVISGTPTSAGSSSFTVMVTDANSLSDTQSLSITISAAPIPPTITTTTLPGGTVDESYSQTVAAAGGSTPYLWTVSSGTLPGGLSINASTGVISGTPTSTVTSTFTVMVTDANSLSDTQSLSITIGSGGSQEQTFQLTTGVNITMVWIPPGEFDMGSPADEVDRDSREGPVHSVTLSSGFWMSKYEVTQGQWESVIGTNPAHSYGVGVNHPVYYVSWDDIQGFLGQTNSGFRLPSEAEWEYAARAGTQTRFYWGDDPSYQDIGDHAVYYLNDPNGTAEVGTKQPNAWGLYDMSGNVWEWVEDDYHSSYSGAPGDGTAWTDDPRATYRVLRGGSWSSYPGLCRSADRFRSAPGIRGDRGGFRLVLVP